MRTFKDKAGAEWQVEITIATNKDVKRLLNYSLYDLVDDGAMPLSELLGDPEKIVDLLYVVCKEQAGSLSMSDEDFGRMFTGPVLEEATEALIGEIVDFFPHREARGTLGRLIAKSKEYGKLLLSRADKEVAEMNLEKLADEAEELIKKELQKKKASQSNGSSGSKPASSASTPTRELSAN